MYLLVFIQNNNETPLALFETIENGQEFAQSIPGYTRREEEGEGFHFVYETFSPKALPDYLELEYKGNRVPITKFMFRDQEDVEIIWREIPNLEEPDQGIVDSQTLVDAYIINNNEVKSYITKREQTYARVKALLEKQGYDVERNFQGSEDGEAIVYKKKDGTEWFFLTHMDPCFVHDAPLEEKDFIQWINDIK